MFAQIEAGQTSATRFADSTKAALTVLVILVIAALVGAKVLQIFGVSLDAFSVESRTRSTAAVRAID